MVTTTQLPSTRVRTSAVEIVDELPRSLETLLALLPSDMQAEVRTLARDARAVADSLRAARRRAAISIAPRIAALKARFCQHGGNRLTLATKSATCGLASPITWEAFALECFGVSVDTIDRWLDDHEARQRFVALLDGREVSYTTRDGFTGEQKTVTVRPGDHAREVLERELDEIDLGTKPATRAWTGLQSGQPTGSKRSPIDHLAVWKKACVALRADNYRALLGKQKTVAVECLSEAILELPADVRESLLEDLRRSLKGDAR